MVRWSICLLLLSFASFGQIATTKTEAYQASFEKKINIDHIRPAGSLNCAQDLPGFVERLFCEVDNLQCLCEKCHDVKTKKEKNGNLQQ